jgi:excisionase family DNA binding protein
MKDQVSQDSELSTLLVTVDEAARRLSIGRSHVYEQMQRGRLRSVQIGRSRRILERDLEDFIERLMDGSDCLPVAAEQPPRRAPVKRLPSRAGRR